MEINPGGTSSSGAFPGRWNSFGSQKESALALAGSEFVV